jgi:hypothetical protein
MGKWNSIQKSKSTKLQKSSSDTSDLQLGQIQVYLQETPQVHFSWAHIWHWVHWTHSSPAKLFEYLSMQTKQNVSQAFSSEQSFWIFFTICFFFESLAALLKRHRLLPFWCAFPFVTCVNFCLSCKAAFTSVSVRIAILLFFLCAMEFVMCIIVYRVLESRIRFSSWLHSKSIENCATESRWFGLHIR